MKLIDPYCSSLPIILVPELHCTLSCANSLRSASENFWFASSFRSGLASPFYQAIVYAKRKQWQKWIASCGVRSCRLTYYYRLW